MTVPSCPVETHYLRTNFFYQSLLVSKNFSQGAPRVEVLISPLSFFNCKMRGNVGKEISRICELAGQKIFGRSRVENPGF